MSQPTWDPHNRRWLFEDVETPAPRRNRRRSVDVIDRSGTDHDHGVADAGQRTRARSSLEAELTHVGFGGRDPRPEDRAPRGPERSGRAHRPADQDVPHPAGDGWRDREPEGDGGWSLLDPYRPDPLADRPEPDTASDAPWYDRGRDARRDAVREDRYDDRVPDRTDTPQPVRPGEFDRAWSDGLTGSPEDRGGPHDRAPRRRAAPDRPSPLGGGREPERRPRPAYGDDRHGVDESGRGRFGPEDGRFGPEDGRFGPEDGRFGPDDARRPRYDAGDQRPVVPERTATIGTDGRWASPPEPRDTNGGYRETGWPSPTAPPPDLGPGPDGYGYDAPTRNGRRSRPPRERGPQDGGFAGRDGIPHDGYDGHGGQGRNGRHPDDLGPERRRGDATGGYGATALDGYGRDAAPWGVGSVNGYAPGGDDAPAPGVDERNGRAGRHGPPAHDAPGPDPRGRGHLAPVDGRGPAPAAYAPDGPNRTRRHGAAPVVPDGFGPEEFDGDGYNLDGLGRDGYDRDGFDLNGYDREGYDRHGFDREGYDRDGYPVDAYEYDRDDDAAAPDPRYDDDYGYAAGYGPDGYRPGRRRAHGGYDDYDDDYAAGTERTLSGGEMPLLDGEAEDPDAEPDELEERRTRRARRASGEKTRRRWPWVVGAAAVAGAVAVPVGMSLLGSSDEGSGTRDAPLLSGSSGTAGLGASGGGQPAAPGAPAAAGQVTYEVNGAGKASSITFGRGQAVAQTQDTPLPFTQNSPAAQEPSDYTLSAVSSGGGDLSCKILLNGAVIAENSAKGDYSAVACNGRR